jgi:uncharacterized membrane protein YbjE (DUF340 family)
VKSSLVVLICLVTGIVSGAASLLPRIVLDLDLIGYALYILLFLVGVGIGCNTEVWRIAWTLNVRVLLVPLSTVVGTLLGAGLVSACVPGLGLRESLAVGSGFGYYSLSSVLIAEIAGRSLGVLALLANILREIITLLTAPLLASRFGRLAPIVSGGATSMDTTLPIISRSVGPEYAMVSVLSGVILTLLAPILITALLR